MVAGNSQNTLEGLPLDFKRLKSEFYQTLCSIYAGVRGWLGALVSGLFHSPRLKPASSFSLGRCWCLFLHSPPHGACRLCSAGPLRWPRAPWGSVGIHIPSSEKEVSFVLEREQSLPPASSLGRNPPVKATGREEGRLWIRRWCPVSCGVSPPSSSSLATQGTSFTRLECVTSPKILLDVLAFTNRSSNVGRTFPKHLSGPEMCRCGSMEMSRRSFP